LEKNRTNGEETLLSGPAREGLALLQELLLCGTCGRALTVHYTGNGGIYPCYLCNRLRRDGLASKDCMNFRCDLLDAAIGEEVLKALQPVEIELALAALVELESRDRALSHQWQMRLERAGYEAALAERRYQEVDPSQRLVAATLERRWNDALGAMGGPQETSRGISARTGSRRHPRAEGSSAGARKGFTACLACSHHIGQRPQTDVATAH
jgi:hypothetical protein